MDIQHKDDGKAGVFYIEQDSSTIAEMAYTWKDQSTIIITHTEVDESLEGKGIGKQLVEKGVEFARKRNIKVIPQCPFAKKVIDRTPKFQDVLQQK